MSDPRTPSSRLDSAIKAIGTIVEACSCRNVKRRGCANGECECNKQAFPRGGILLPVPCQRPLHRALAVARGAIEKERA